MYIFTILLSCITHGESQKLVVCEQDATEPEMALNGLISVSSESSKQLPTEVSDELASIQDAGTKNLLQVDTAHLCRHLGVVRKKENMASYQRSW